MNGEIPLEFGNTRQLALKRAMDLFVALTGMFFLAPLLIMLAVLVKLDSPGPAFFFQERVGKGGRSFKMIKFRSMVYGAERRLNEILAGDPQQRLNWDQFQKLYDDPRLTRVGRFLRRTSLDELPQLWNVIRGEMSLVGARPILFEQCEIYGPVFSSYINFLPGMTGLWQVEGRNQTSFNERAELDFYYYSHWTIGLDLQLLIRSVPVVLKGEFAF